MNKTDYIGYSATFGLYTAGECLLAYLAFKDGYVVLGCVDALFGVIALVFCILACRSIKRAER